jgi:hypothetical protein
VPFLEKEIADLFEYRRSMLRPKALEPPANDSKVVEGLKVDKKPPSGGPKQGYKPKGLMIDLGSL